ncbi:hypothetical protein CIP107547_00948 [Corynebacterium diphtheriae]|uniref:Uncharacterized protein n=2 Tax=Corynebacterium diphtheriae TaxID=1717 RepID=A0A811G418_CORDP|nr:hypothetical protein CIP107547_00948 [Corynebacterium diphtheriae]
MGKSLSPMHFSNETWAFAHLTWVLFERWHAQTTPEPGWLCIARLVLDVDPAYRVGIRGLGSDRPKVRHRKVHTETR